MKKNVIVLLYILITASCIAQSNSDKARANFISAQEAFNNGDFQLSINNLNNAITLLGSTNVRIQYLLVKSYYGLQDYQKAKEAIQKYFGLKPPEDAGYNEMLGFINKIDKKLEEQKKSDINRKRCEEVKETNKISESSNEEVNKKVEPNSSGSDNAISKSIKKQMEVNKTNETTPSFNGGENAIIEFFNKNINYPKEAIEEGIQGTVFVSFIVDETGKVTNVKVLRGIGGGCDEEAVRVVNMFPNWNPGKKNGEFISSEMIIPVKFNLDKGSK